MATLTANMSPRIETYNTENYQDQDLVEITYDGGDKLIIIGDCTSDGDKYGYDEKFDIYGNLVAQEYTGFKKDIALQIYEMTNAQYKLLEEHWLKQTTVRIKDTSDEIYHNLLLMGRNLGLSKNYDVNGVIYWTGSLKFRQK